MLNSLFPAWFRTAHTGGFAGASSWAREWRMLLFSIRNLGVPPKVPMLHERNNRPAPVEVEEVA
jgi:hypothetical protein